MFTKMHIIMHSDEMNKLEVRNVEKYPLFAVFYEVNKNWTCVKSKIK